MRKSIVVAVSLLFVVVSAIAQQQPSRSNAVSVFVTDLSLSSSGGPTGTKLGAGYGAAFEHMFNDRFSGEVSVTSERQQRTFFTVNSTGAIVFDFRRSNTLYPIDANASYHFLTNGPWKPYVGAGLRYVSYTFHGDSALGSFQNTTRSVNPEVSGGITYQFRPNLGLRFDAKQIVGSNGSDIGDPAFKASVGLSLRF
jgi:Outer membrane protein W